ncbi:MAG: hypothetical protein ACPHCN_09325 [Mycobacterium sp.]
MTQRSTSIGLMLKHCPKALDYNEQGVPYDRGIFAVGTAAHDILHAIGEARGSLVVVPKVVEHLIAKGRSGLDAEGPLNADAVLEGRDLAVAYAAQHEWRADETWFELGIGLGNDLKTIVPYRDEKAYFHSRPDMAQRIGELDDDGESVNDLIEVVDYKSSWAAGENELGTFQRKTQAFAVKRWLESRGESADGVKVTVVNLRTHARYSRIIWWNSEEWAQIEPDTRTLVDAANIRPRKKSPGAGCVDCPFLHHCGPELPADPTDAYPIHKGAVTAAEKRLRSTLREHKDRVAIPGGTVGYEATTKAVVRPTAAERLWFEISAGRVEQDSLASQLAIGALGSVLSSKSAIERLAKYALPDGRQRIVMARRRAVIDECIDYEPAVKFGIQKEKA